MIKKTHAQSAGFEPARAEPNGFLVHRLNHSATTAAVDRSGPVCPFVQQHHMSCKIKMLRCRQGSNLCGNIPMDFKSIALTTRPRQLLVLNLERVYMNVGTISRLF